MTKQPEALRLADILEKMPLGKCDEQAAAELRRLHEVNQELLEALEGAANYIDKLGGVSGQYRQLIAKATGEQV